MKILNIFPLPFPEYFYAKNAPFCTFSNQSNFFEKSTDPSTSAFFQGIHRLRHQIYTCDAKSASSFANSTELLTAAASMNYKLSTLKRNCTGRKEVCLKFDRFCFLHAKMRRSYCYSIGEPRGPKSKRSD